MLLNPFFGHMNDEPKDTLLSDLPGIVGRYPYFSETGLSGFGASKEPTWHKGVSFDDVKFYLNMVLLVHLLESDCEKRRAAEHDEVSEVHKEALKSLSLLSRLVTGTQLTKSLEGLADSLNKLKPQIDRAVEAGKTDTARRLDDRFGIQSPQRALARLELRVFFVLQETVDAPENCLLKHAAQMCVHFGANSSDDADGTERIKQAYYRLKRDEDALAAKRDDLSLDKIGELLDSLMKTSGME